MVYFYVEIIINSLYQLLRQGRLINITTSTSCTVNAWIQTSVSLSLCSGCKILSINHKSSPGRKRRKRTYSHVCPCSVGAGLLLSVTKQSEILLVGVPDDAAAPPPCRTSAAPCAPPGPRLDPVWTPSGLGLSPRAAHSSHLDHFLSPIQSRGW